MRIVCIMHIHTLTHTHTHARTHKHTRGERKHRLLGGGFADQQTRCPISVFCIDFCSSIDRTETHVFFVVCLCRVVSNANRLYHACTHTHSCTHTGRTKASFARFACLTNKHDVPEMI